MRARSLSRLKYAELRDDSFFRGLSLKDGLPGSVLDLQHFIERMG